MNICRKTYRECAVAELIGKVGGKLEGKGTQATSGNFITFVLGNIQQIRAGLTCI